MLLLGFLLWWLVALFRLDSRDDGGPVDGVGTSVVLGVVVVEMSTSTSAIVAIERHRNSSGYRQGTEAQAYDGVVIVCNVNLDNLSGLVLRHWIIL